MATAIYMRVSDEKQEDGVSFETQLDTLNKFCDYKGYENIKSYKEVRSARTLDRAVVNELINDVKKGRISRVIIYKLDRLTRWLRDLMNLLHLFDEHNCELHSTYENIDTQSPSGRMLVQVLGIIAEWESANTSMRVKNNMETLSRQGIWQSSIPFGFYHGEDKRLKINKEESDIVKEAVNLVLEGESVSSAEDIINKRYALNWHNGYLPRKLKMPSTIGNIERNGKLYKNTHEPLMSEFEHNKLMQILEGNSTGRRNIKHDDLFRRKVKCMQCNYTMSLVARSHNNYKKTYYSYVCDDCYDNKRPFISVSESQLEDAMLNYMDKLKLQDFSEVESSDNTKDVERIKRRLQAIKKERERIQRAWIKEMMTDEELDKFQSELDAETDDLNKELLTLNKNAPSISNEELKELSVYFNEAYNELTKIEKRKFIQKHVKEIYFERKLLKGYKKKYSVTVKNIYFY